MVGMWFEPGKLYLRQEVRKKLNLNVTNMTFIRWEYPTRRVRLIPIKAGGVRFAHVRYEGANLNEFFTSYMAKVAA